MCDQTEVTYAPGDVVWVKLSHVWWPGQVYDYDKLPEEITVNLRKKPLAVVKFFQEDTFEYVKNLNMIYHYNCRNKEQFIKKGLDLVRSSNSRDVPSNMKMFPNDVVMAEHLSGGDPNILNSETFAPEKKSDYKDLFGSPKKLSGKKAKLEFLKKEKSNFKSKKMSFSPTTSDRRSLPAGSVSIPRPITHPRFITKALEGRSDHEVRIRCQIPSPNLDDEPEVKHYNCHLCDFQTTRLNVIVLHNKSHSASFIEARNVIKARSKAKEKERHSIASFTINEKTPTTITSRGRVKNVPKKLMDYTEEPPQKMLKEKVASVKKEVKDKSPEKVSTKCTPKKHRDYAEMKALKKPLFGKRKTAKEKAEIAAKIKQENEAMKETLLKDWEDDEVNEEEIELDKLKQALDSTTMSTEDDNEISRPCIEENIEPEASSNLKKEKLPETIPVESKNVTGSSNDSKAKVFEFDDSEDSLPLTNFRLKNQREKFTDDKFKKPKPPKPLIKANPKQKIVASPQQSSQKNNKEEEDKETAKFNEAFNALLEETVFPTLPEIPKISQPPSKPTEQISDQTSDISSSTDLLEVANSLESLSHQTNDNIVDSMQDNTLKDDDLKMECTSSDNEEIVSTEQSGDTVQEDQKNLKEISVLDPSTEINSELTAGVPTTADIVECETVIGDNLQICEDYTTTEITSTCDVTKLENENSKPSENFEEPHLEPKTTDNALSVSVPETESHGLQESKISFYLPKDDLTAPNTTQVLLEKPVENTVVETSEKQDESLKTESVSFNNELEGNKTQVMSKKENNGVQSFNQSPKKRTFLSFSSDGNYQETGMVEEEVVRATQDKKLSELKTEKVVQQIVKPVFRKVNSGKKSQPKISTENLMSIQLIMPDGTECITTPIQVSPHQQSIGTLQSLPKLEIQEGCKIENQGMSQNLQDMELDINSMPVIIGGDDFIQPEQPKPNFVSIQPKYSESIVISHKKTPKSPSPRKSESVIMQLGEPSTSNKSLQPIISIPSKVGKSRSGKALKPATKQIKLPASTLKSLGFTQKLGNQQVLILKSTGGQSKQDKGLVQKNKVPLNFIQHGNKFLLVNSPQVTGQNTIKLDPHQQQLLSQGGKLVPGTKVLTSKVVATTTSPKSGSGINQIITSQSISKPTQKLVISKGGMISNTTKGVIINNTSGNLMATVPGTHTVSSSKGQTIITQNIINTKGGLVLPSSSPSASPSKTATIITSQALASSKSMIFSPMSSKGETIISGNQKLRIVSSKAPLKGTRFVVQSPQKKLNDPQIKSQPVKLISPTGNTILIQTSQGIIAKSIAPSLTTTTASARQSKRPDIMKTVLTTVPTQAKIRVTSSPTKLSQIGRTQNIQKTQMLQQSQLIQQPQKSQIIQQSHQTKVIQQPQIIQKTQQPQIIQQPQFVKQQPEIAQHTQIIQQTQGALQTTPVVKKVSKPRQTQSTTQKPPRKSTPRAPKGTKGKIVSSTVVTPTTPDQIVLSTSSSLPVIGQTTMIQGQLPQNSNEVVYLTLDESGAYRQVDKSMVSFEGMSSEAPQTFFIPANNQIQDMGNLLIALDSAGNIVNLSQPPVSTSYTAEVPTSGQDILAKALENTQVLQPETILPEIDVSSALSSSMDSTVLTSSAFSDQSQYPPKLSHNVLETSLTLNQPIMTPLEVPSAVSPNLGQISSLPSNYISSNLLTSPQKHLPQSMPILTEDALANQAQGEPVFLLDSSNNLIPATSGSQISFQLTLDDNNVIMTSGTGSVLPHYQVVSNELLPQQLVAAEESQGVKTVEDASQNIMKDEERGYNIITTTEPETIIPDHIEEEQKSGILREALEASQTTAPNSEEYRLNEDDISQNESLMDQNPPENEYNGNFVDEKVEQQCEVVEDHEFVDHQESYPAEDAKSAEEVGDEVKHSLKRSLAEEETVSSSSDLEDSSKKMRIDER